MQPIYACVDSLIDRLLVAGYRLQVAGYMSQVKLGKPVKHFIKQCLTNFYLVLRTYRIYIWWYLMKNFCLMKYNSEINFSSNIFLSIIRNFTFDVFSLLLSTISSNIYQILQKLFDELLDWFSQVFTGCMSQVNWMTC